LPVNVKQQQPIWSTQTEFDLEALGRMDFHEKKLFAEAMEARAKEIKLALDEQAVRQEKAREDELAKRLDRRAEAIKAASAADSKPPANGSGASGIGQP